MSIESVMPSNHLILCHLLLLLPSIFPSIGVFSNNLDLHIRWPKYWPSIPPMSIQRWFLLGLTGLISLLSKRLSRVFSSTTVWKHQFFSAQSSLWSNSHIHMKSHIPHHKIIGKTIALTTPAFVGKMTSLLLKTLFRFVIPFLPRRKRFLVWDLGEFKFCSNPQLTVFL